MPVGHGQVQRPSGAPPSPSPPPAQQKSQGPFKYTVQAIHALAEKQVTALTRHRCVSAWSTIKATCCGWGCASRRQSMEMLLGASSQYLTHGQVAVFSAGLVKGLLRLICMPKLTGCWDCRSLRARRQESINLPDFIQFATVAILGGCFWYQVGVKPTSTAVQNTLGEQPAWMCALQVLLV